MPVTVPGSVGSTTEEFDRNWCQITHNIQEARDAAERGDKGARAALDKRVAENRKRAGEAVQRLEDAYGRNPFGDSTVARGLRKLANGFQQMLANDGIYVLDFQRNVIAGKNGSTQIDHDIYNAHSRARGITAGHLKGNEPLTNELAVRMNRAAESMGFTVTNANGVVQSAADQVYDLAAIRGVLLDELSGRSETMWRRYIGELNGGGGKARAEARERFKVHRDVNRQNAELDAIVSHFGFKKGQVYDRLFDPAAGLHLLRTTDAHADVLDPILETLQKVRVRTMELQVKSGKVGQHEQRVVAGYGLQHYFPNTGIGGEWKVAREYDAALFNRRSPHGAANTEDGTLGVRAGRGELGRNGVSSLLADMDEASASVGDRQRTETLKNIANDLGDNANVRNLGSVPTHRANPETGAWEKHPKLEDLIALAVGGDYKNNGRRVFLNHEGETASVLLVTDPKLAEVMREQERKNFLALDVDADGAQGAVAKVLTRGAAIQGKAYTQYNPVHWPKDYMRNAPQAIGKLINTRGYAEAGTFIKNQPRFLKEAFKDTFPDGFFTEAARVFGIGDKPKLRGNVLPSQSTEFGRLTNEIFEAGFHTGQSQQYGFAGTENNLLKNIRDGDDWEKARAWDDLLTRIASTMEQSVRAGYLHAGRAHAPKREAEGIPSSDYQLMQEQKELLDFSLQGKWDTRIMENFTRTAINGAAEQIRYLKNGRHRTAYLGVMLGSGALRYSWLYFLHQALYGEEGAERFLNTSDETELRYTPIYLPNREGNVSDSAIGIQNHYGGGMFQWLGGHMIKKILRYQTGMDESIDMNDSLKAMRKGVSKHWAPVELDFISGGNALESLVEFISPVALEGPAVVGLAGAERRIRGDATAEESTISANTEQYYIDMTRDVNSELGTEWTPRDFKRLHSYVNPLMPAIEFFYDAYIQDAGDIHQTAFERLPLGLNLGVTTPGKETDENYYLAKRRVQKWTRRLENADVEFNAGNKNAWEELNEDAGGIGINGKLDTLANIDAEINELNGRVRERRQRRALPLGNPDRESSREVEAALQDDLRQLDELKHRYYLAERAMKQRY